MMFNFSLQNIQTNMEIKKQRNSACNALRRLSHYCIINAIASTLLRECWISIKLHMYIVSHYSEKKDVLSDATSYQTQPKHL